MEKLRIFLSHFFKNTRSTPFVILFSLTLLLAFTDLQDFRPNMDSMTYGILAKNILKTGDWTTLHYTKQAYWEFYQHPPFGIWFLAVVFKLLGTSNLALKFASALIMIGTTLLTGAWGFVLFKNQTHAPQRESATAALLSGLILLTSTRYLKPAAGYLLDSPLALLLVAAGLSFHLSLDESGSRWRHRGLSFLSGFLGALSLLCKGLPALVLPALIFTIGIVSPKTRKSALGFILGCSVPLFGFMKFGHGDVFIREYWSQSVSARVGGNVSFSNHLQPVLSLLKTWIPWFPIWLVSLSFLFKRLWKQPTDVRVLLPVGLSLGILLGFSLNGRFLEHYLVPFFPFAALSISLVWTSWLATYSERIAKATAALTALALGAALFLPMEFQGDTHRSPLVRLHERAQTECKMISPSTRLIYAPQTLDLWYGLALGAWATPWEPTVAFSEADIPREETILLVRKSEKPKPAHWNGTVLLQEGEFVLETNDAQLSALCHAAN